MTEPKEEKKEELSEEVGKKLENLLRIFPAGIPEDGDMSKLLERLEEFEKEVLALQEIVSHVPDDEELIN